MNAADFRWHRLEDGRRLAYAEYGDAAGYPVMLFHGLPGSRLQVHPDAGCCPGLRLLAVERPGFGRSDSRPGREIRDWAGDVAGLADHLGLERFGICAWSGGGPYGLACAAGLPERVAGVMLVSSMGPLDQPGAMERMILSNRALFECARRAPFLLDYPVAAMAAIATWNPAWRLSGLAEQLCEADQAMLADERLRGLMEAEVGESLRDPSATRHELALLVKAWGLKLDEIRVPVVIVHGDADYITPFPMGEWLAGQVAGSRLLTRRGEGHFLIFRHWRGVLRLLVKRCREFTARGFAAAAN